MESNTRKRKSKKISKKTRRYNNTINKTYRKEKLNMKEEKLSTIEIILLIIPMTIFIIVMAFFCAIVVVNAEGTTDIEFENYNLNYNDTSVATERILFQNNNGIYKNWGRSNLIFTISVYRYADGITTQVPMLSEVRVKSNNNIYVSCNIGNNPLVYDNSDVMKATTYSVLCDTAFGEVGLQEIRAFFQPGVNTQFGVQTSTQMVVYKNIEDRMYTLLKSIINNQGIINNSIGSLNTLLNTKLQEIITYQYNESIALAHIEDGITNVNNNILNLINAITTSNQAIINNQNAIAQQQEENQKVCNEKKYTYENTINQVGFLTSTGQINGSGNYNYTTEYIEYLENYNINIYNTMGNNNGPSICFYNNNKTLISCVEYNNNNMENVTIPNNTRYFRFSIYRRTTTYTYLILKKCQNGNQAISEKQDEIINYGEDIEPDEPDQEIQEDQERENQLLEDIEELNLSEDIDIDLEQNSTNWVWTQLTNAINTNAKVLGCMISVLVLGVIKTILGR